VRPIVRIAVTERW